MKPCCKWCNRVFEDTFKFHSHYVDEHLTTTPTTNEKVTICFVCDNILTTDRIDRHMKNCHPQHCLWCLCKVVKREQCPKLEPYCTAHNEICNTVLEKLWIWRKISRVHKKGIQQIWSENVSPYSMALRLLRR